MADPRLKAAKAQQQVVLVQGNAAAPFITIDGVIAGNSYNNSIHIEVGANTMVPSQVDATKLKAQTIVTAHLRLSYYATAQMIEVMRAQLVKAGITVPEYAQTPPKN